MPKKGGNILALLASSPNVRASPFGGLGPIGEVKGQHMGARELSLNSYIQVSCRLTL